MIRTTIYSSSKTSQTTTIKHNIACTHTNMILHKILNWERVGKRKREEINVCFIAATDDHSTNGSAPTTQQKPNAAYKIDQERFPANTIHMKLRLVCGCTHNLSMDNVCIYTLASAPQMNAWKKRISFELRLYSAIFFSFILVFWPRFDAIIANNVCSLSYYFVIFYFSHSEVFRRVYLVFPVSKPKPSYKHWSPGEKNTSAPATTVATVLRL